MELTLAKIDPHALRYKCERHGEAPKELQVNLGLLASVIGNGIKNPLIVTTAPDGHTYVWLGNQRLCIARQLKMETVDCIFVNNQAELEEALALYEECK